MTGTQQHTRRNGTRAEGSRPAPVRRRRTRLDYLDTAVTLANTHSRLSPTLYSYAVAHVDIATVAEAAGVSRTALYRLWETQESFRADLTAYLAAIDDAAWMRLDERHLATPLAYPDDLHELTRALCNADQRALARDPQPLLRAGISGYPNADAVTAVIAEREQRRLACHAERMDRALRSAGRRCADGLTPHDISLVASCLADGLALAARTTPPALSLVVEDEAGLRWSLFAAAVRAAVDGMSCPDPTARARRARREPPPYPRAAAPAELLGRRLTVRRLHYLRLAAELAGSEPAHGEPTQCCALGYVSLDALARATGVTRAAVRKLWPTQAAFHRDLFAHLLARDREAIRRRLDAAAASAAPGRAEEVLAQLGGELAAQIRSDLGRVSHLTFAPQLVLPDFRAHVHHQVGPLLDDAAASLAALLAALGRRPQPHLGERRLAVLVLALLDGATRLLRTLPERPAEAVVAGGQVDRLLATGLTQVLLGLSHSDDRTSSTPRRAAEPESWVVTSPEQ